MFRFLVDTCVWLDLAGDSRKLPVLGVVEELQRRGMIQLLVPRVVLDEFTRNRTRIAKNSEKSLGSHFREVRDAVERAGGNPRKQRTLLTSLQDVAHRVPLIGGQANQTLDRIEALLRSGLILDASDQAKLRAAQRALEKRAPFHKGKNSMADAMIIEMFGECARDSKAAGLRFAFVTLNKEDFSAEHGSQKLPHPDIAQYFSKVKALYFINLAEALRRVQPSLVTDIMIEHSWTMEPRALSEMLDAEELLTNQIWYNRHMVRRERVEAGKIKVVDVEKYPMSYPERTVQRDIWEGALRAARKVEKRFGKENLGPWSDFEWGMINGKLSALRWVMGDEWDMLDT